MSSGDAGKSPPLHSQPNEAKILVSSQSDIIESSVNNQTTGCICEEVSLDVCPRGWWCIMHVNIINNQSPTNSLQCAVLDIMITERIITYGKDIAKSTKLRCILNIAVNNLAVARDRFAYLKRCSLRSCSELNSPAALSDRTAQILIPKSLSKMEQCQKFQCLSGLWK